ncbi:sigma-70 family RNA polymerase sigma factor [Mycolicibacterium boenickei]|uniref:Sigma-70 family RNA polymerase sigma factor n=1 Tax=Mycolicibacterium boenickei TaxID=146017 RepID=A0ABM7J5Z2_9MYCO|nr:sigma-70 family RNA polymerase sigma factor [Mycolicibacterium boenickei]BBX94685.1 hypothetical protein MBOE_63340 [Mycolicibacterium boenickei]
MSDDTATDWDQDDHPDYDLVQDVLLDPDHELANPDSYPRMWNLSAGMAFFEAVIRPDIPERPEFVPIFMPGIASADRDTYGARIFSIARWNSLWEAAQYRRRFFSDDTDPDASDWERLPADLARIAELGDNNIVFIPRTKTRYYDYAPLFHLLPRATLDRFGLPLLHAGQWPFWAELVNPDPYLPADFHQRLTDAWGATVWRHLMPSSPISRFTKDDPIRILAHNLDFWIPAVAEAMEDEMRTWPIVDTGITPGPVTLSNGELLEGATMGGPRKGSDIWSGEHEAAEFVERTVEAADHTGQLRDILDAVRSHRAHDDFSDRWSHAKEDFERKLNHTRSRVKVTFIELDDTTPVHGPETEIVGQLACSDFLTLLNPKDREVVVVLRTGVTSLTEVGNILGYSNHSAVSKRLTRIRKQAARYFNDN